MITKQEQSKRLAAYIARTKQQTALTMCIILGLIVVAAVLAGVVR